MFDSNLSSDNTHPWRILLCDDSPLERVAMGHFLRSEGYEVDEANDGKEALHHLKHHGLDLLVLDLQMPEVDGFAVLGYIQQHRPGLPVILMSGMPLDQIQHKMHALPHRELPPLFIKPVDPHQILDVVAMQLAGKLPGNVTGVE